MPDNCVINTLLGVALVGVVSGLSAQSSHFKDTAADTSPVNRFTVVDGMALAEGDIFIGKLSNSHAGNDSALQVEDLQRLVEQRGFSVNTSFSVWQDGLVPYTIAADIDSDLAESVLEAVEHWNQNSSISLIETSSLRASAAGVDDASDFIEFVKGPGCASWVGRQGGNQPIWVSNTCSAGSIIHEIGHALGLLHEHTRDDRDQFVHVNLNNVQAGKEFNFDKVTAGVAPLGPYDYESIMHYGEYFFSANGESTLTPINAQAGTIIGQRLGTSPGDLAAIDTLYATDLALTVQSQASTDNNSTDLILTVSNNADMGAHDIRVELVVPEGVNRYSSNAGWQCESVPGTAGQSAKASDRITCELPRLSVAQTTTLNLIVSGRFTTQELQIGIASKSYDSDKTNNGAELDSNQTPSFGQALAEEPMNTATDTADSVQSGAVGPWLLLMIGCGPALRRRKYFR